jgi:hypothetical protein
VTEREMRAYLLGQAAAQDAERLEVRLLEDEDVYATLRGVEDDLFDEYARGGLTEEERQQFLERYGTERPRVLVAHALAARTLSLPHVPVPRSLGRRWMPFAAAAAVVAGVGLATWMRSGPEDGSVTAPRTERSAQSLAAPVVLNVTLGASRSASSLPEAVLPTDTSTLELRVRLNPADRFDSYSMELRSASGASVWRADKLAATVDNGDLIVVGSVLASALPAGSYELAVRGSGAAGSGDVLGYTGVSIRR